MTIVPLAASATSLDRHRYPGVRSFQEPDAARFFGRPKAAEELLLRVLSVRLLLQFAPSGAGKTSLLNAGLFPRLRPHGCLPADVRLNRPEESLVEAVARSLRDAAVRSGIDDPVIPAKADDVWDLLAGTQVWTRDLLLLTPVLVFDQFEEVFTLRDEAFRRRFAREIGALSRGRHDAAPADAADAAAPDVKIIISLREEYLGSLEEMTVAIPELFRERLRLSPLTNAEAREAIVEPARLAGDWLSPPFEFDEACLNGLIDFIDGVSERIHLIEPLTLQLVCQRAEAIAAARANGGAPPALTFADFGGPAGLETLVHHYYSGELDKLPDRATRRRAVAMFEEGLLDPSGKRLMLEQDEIRRQYGLEEPALGALVESRLLRREPRNESIFYEISHDRLTDVIARHRTARLPRWVWPALGVAGLLIVVLVVSMAMIFRAKSEAESARRSTQDARTTTARALNVLFGDELGRRLREAGLSDAFERMLKLTSVDDQSDRLVRASQLRRLGELAWERDTVATTGQRLAEALAILDRAMQEGNTSAAVRAERAQILKALGDVRKDEGQVSQAAALYTAAVNLWKDVTSGEHDPTTVLNAVEAQTSLAAIWERLGSAGEAEAAYANAAYRAVEVLTSAYQQAPREGSDNAFLLGRAMQVYADAVLSLAEVWSLPDDLKHARALAAELMHLRPLSAQARIQLGTASAMYSGALTGATAWTSARRLFDEADRQFRELTQFDRQNRRLYREWAASRLVTASAIGSCADSPACRKALRPGEIETAESAALSSTGVFQELVDLDPGNRSLRDDVAWGKEVEASLKRARGARDGALSRLEEALALRRAGVVDPKDVVNRSPVVILLLTKARTLQETGRREDALAAIDEALAAAEQIPNETWRRSRRIESLHARSEVLTALGRKADARSATDEKNRLAALAGNPARTKKDAALALNKEANQLYTAAGAAAAPEKGRAYDVAAEKYRAAIIESPADPVLWSNLRAACSAAASALSDALDQTPADTALARRTEAKRRCALESAWMAWILSDEGEPTADRANRLRTLYEDRRSLAKLLRNDHQRVREALALAEHGVREAEDLVERDQSASTLFLIADSYYGLGMMREESHREGWEQAIRAALVRGEQLRDKESANAGRRTWIGQVRLELAKRLDTWKRPGAAEERGLARRECQDALRLATTDADRGAAQSCLTDAQK